MAALLALTSVCTHHRPSPGGHSQHSLFLMLTGLGHRVSDLVYGAENSLRTGHRGSQPEHRLYRPELIAKYYWKQRLECQKVLGFHHEIFTLLHSRGWKLFPGNKCLKKTGMGHPHTTQSAELWDAKIYWIFSTLITSSHESAHGQSSNSEGKKKVLRMCWS